MCNAADVADYILQEKGRLTAFQLQKLLYYCKAWGLVVNKSEVFPEPVKAWENGPVVYDVFKQHAGRRTVVASDLNGDKDMIPPQYLPVLDAVISSYGSLSGDQLRDLTHSETPWKEAYNGTNGLTAGTITDDAMEDYYSSLQASDMTRQQKHHVPHFVVEPVIHVSEEDFEWLTSQL